MLKPELNKNLATLLSLKFRTRRSVREAVIAVNILVTTPIPKMSAKPFITEDAAK